MTSDALTIAAALSPLASFNSSTASFVIEARHRGLPSCVLTFEPHPRDFFARRTGQPQLAPARIANLRDKLTELERCGTAPDIRGVEQARDAVVGARAR